MKSVAAQIEKALIDPMIQRMPHAPPSDAWVVLTLAVREVRNRILSTLVLRWWIPDKYISTLVVRRKPG